MKPKAFLTVLLLIVGLTSAQAGFGVLFPGNRLSDLETGIEMAGGGCPTAGDIYNMAGQRLQKPQRGINIVAGKKILVK